VNHSTTPRVEKMTVTLVQKQSYCSLARISRICLMTLYYLGHMKTYGAATPSDKHLDPWPTIDASSRHSIVHSTPGKGVDHRTEASKPGERKGSHRSRGGVPSSSLPHEICVIPCRCKFFLWDLFSLFKYRETTFRAQKNTFEGKGGKKFVRIQPNTLLEKWYPELRAGKLRTDKCMLCGYSWEDHLEYWWHCQRRRGGVSSAFEKSLEKSAASRDYKFSYHERYVDEINSSNNRRSHRRVREVREAFDGETLYFVPPFDPFAGLPKSVGSMLILALARAASLLRVEELMWLSAVESLRSRERDLA